MTLSDERELGSRSRGERTRARILAAAAELIAEQGWEGVSTRDIAGRAGVTQGVVTYHWRSKDELLRTAALEATEEALAGPLADLFESEPLAEGLVAMGSILAAIRDDPNQVRLLFETMLRAGRDSELREAVAVMLREFRSSLAEALRREQAAGRAASDLDADACAIALTAGLDGLFLHVIVDGSLDPEPAVRALVEGLGLASRDRSKPGRSQPKR